jgi:AraC family transcriptional regulator
MIVLEKGQYTGVILREVRENDLLASISSYDKNGFNDRWHCHVNAHISFVLHGGCSEEKTEAYERLPGRTTFYSAGEPHRIIDMNNSTHVNLELDAAFFNKYDISRTSFSQAASNTPDGQFLMSKVCHELNVNDSFTVTSLRMLLLEFLQQAPPCACNPKIPGWIRNVHELLHDEWDKTLQLEDLSKAAGVHPGTISHYFPRYFSCTLGTYMRKLKVEKALTFMKSPDVSLTSVAYTCGFFDQSHFIKSFKEFTGLRPAQYIKYLQPKLIRSETK